MSHGICLMCTWTRQKRSVGQRTQGEITRTDIGRCFYCYCNI